MPTIEELSADLEKAQGERDELAAKVEKLEKKLEKAAKKDEQPKELNKADLPKEVREALEKAEAERDELKKAADEAREIAKAERETRITREFVQKAEDEFSHIAGEAEEFGKLLKSASEKLSKEEFDALEGRLRSAEELVSKSELLKEMGRSGDPTPGSDELEAKLSKAVEEIRKADPSVSDYDAQVRALRKHPELQREYHASVR